MKSKVKIALLAGGIGGEREVSLKTAEEIFKALNKQKYEIFKYDPREDLREFVDDAMAKKFDLVFPALHGPLGEDGRIQGLMDSLGLRYLFSGTLASALAMDKARAKTLVKEAGIEVAPDITICREDEFNTKKVIAKLSLPLVVKPMRMGSSVGMSIVENEKGLEPAAKKAFKHDSEIMLEKFIKGRELTVAVMEDYEGLRALPTIEIIPKVSNWFDYSAKYDEGGSDEICPAEIPEEINDKVQGRAIKAFESLDCRGLARSDFIWDEWSGKMYFLEINTIPGMTSTSLVPKAAKTAGMEFEEFLDQLIERTLKNDSS